MVVPVVVPVAPVAVVVAAVVLAVVAASVVTLVSACILIVQESSIFSFPHQRGILPRIIKFHMRADMTSSWYLKPTKINQ